VVSEVKELTLLRCTICGVVYAHLGVIELVEPSGMLELPCVICGLAERPGTSMRRFEIITAKQVIT
jgi:hypothetical protein